MPRLDRATQCQVQCFLLPLCYSLFLWCCTHSLTVVCSCSRREAQKLTDLGVSHVKSVRLLEGLCIWLEWGGHFERHNTMLSMCPVHSDRLYKRK